MRSSLLLFALALAGCTPRYSDKSLTNDPPPVDVLELFDAHLANSAQAKAKYGERPIIRVMVDAVRPAPGGYVLTRDHGERITTRLYFNETEGAKLSGVKPEQTLKVRGTVTRVTARGLMATDCELVP